MTTLRIENAVPYVTVVIRAEGRELVLRRMIVDTGSNATLVNTDMFFAVGIGLQLDGRVRTLRSSTEETVISRDVDEIIVGERSLKPFTVHLGELAYGIPMDGILGMDFLLAVGVVIDLNGAELR